MATHVPRTRLLLRLAAAGTARPTRSAGGPERAYDPAGRGLDQERRRAGGGDDRKVAELLRAATAGKTAEDFVLTREGNKPIRDFRVAWENLVARAGLSGLIPHDLRRSAAKALRAANVPESVVMTMGGWKTPAMFRRYAIVSTTDQRAAVEKLERARARARTTNSPDFGPYSAETTSAPEPGTGEKVQ